MLTYLVSPCLDSGRLARPPCFNTHLAAALLHWPRQCSGCGRGDGTPSNSNFLIDRMQDIASILYLPAQVGRSSRNFILSCCTSCEAPHGSVEYHSLTIIIVRNSINFRQDASSLLRRCTPATVLRVLWPYPSPVYESSNIVASFYPTGSRWPVKV
jgi:hypothetical protein